MAQGLPGPILPAMLQKEEVLPKSLQEQPEALCVPRLFTPSPLPESCWELLGRSGAAQDPRVRERCWERCWEHAESKQGACRHRAAAGLRGGTSQGGLEGAQQDAR